MSQVASDNTVPTDARAPLSCDSTAVERELDDATIRQLVLEHHPFIWKLLARLGVAEADVDDAAQQVFLVLARRGSLHIKPGSERAFLFGIALKVVSTHRRTLSRRREVCSAESLEFVDQGSSPEALTDQKKARELLMTTLESMPLALRVVFVLYELEDTSTHEIARLLGVPRGTVASRLRRAREHFSRCVANFQDRTSARRGEP